MEDVRRREPTRKWMAGSLIWLLTALALLAAWTAVASQIEFERSEAHDAAVAQVQNRAMAFEQYVARTFEAADLVTRHAGEKFILRGDLPQVPGADPVRISDGMMIRRDLLKAVHIVAPNGDLLATTLPGIAARNLASHPLTQSLRAIPDERLLITPPMESTILPGRYIHAVRRVRDESGETRGFVGTQIEPRVLSDFLKDASFSPTDLISVIGLDGITLARREGDRITSGEDLRGRLVMKMQQAAPNGTYVGPSSLDGHVRYFSHRRLKDYPFFVTAGVSRTAVMAPVMKRAQIYRGVMLAVTIASLLLAWLAVETLVRRQRGAIALSQANRRLRNAQRLARIGDWEYQVESGEIVWSDQLCEMYERPKGQNRLTVEEFKGHLDEQGQRMMDRAVALAIRSGEPQSYELRVHLPSGKVSDRFIVAAPVVEDGGGVRSIQGTDQDVTSDRLLHALQRQVTHLARVDAMNNMASALAHELNQPLTAANNYLTGGERLAQSDPQSPMLIEAVASARQQVQLAAKIIRRVRDMLGPRSTSARTANLRDVTEEAVGLMVAAGTCTAAQLKVDVPDVGISADPIQVQQVLINLIRNACEAAAQVPQPRVAISAAQNGRNFVVVSVADNGVGIAEPQDDLFSPFISSKEGGLGLGLSISRTIVEYHGGRIWVGETGPTGTTIVFSLPLAESAEVPHRQPHARSAARKARLGV